MAPLTIAVGEQKPVVQLQEEKAQKDGAVMRPTDSKATTMPEFIDECFKKKCNKDVYGLA